MRGRVLAAVLLLIASTSARAVIWEWPLGPEGVFRVDVPSGWTAKLQGPDAPSGRAVAITPPQGVPLVLLITPVPFSGNADTHLKDVARLVVAELQRISEEPALEAKWYEEAISRGFYVSATDKTVTQPTLQDFKYSIEGRLVTGRLAATFTILTNLSSGPERERALGIVRSARHEPAAMPVADNKGTVALALPGRAWRVLIDLPGFALNPVLSQPTQRGVRLGGSNKSTGVNFSAFLEPSSPGRTAVDYREADWVRIQPTGPFIDVRRSQRDGMALIEYTFTGNAETRKIFDPFDQRHVNAHIVNDGVWLRVHLSKVSYTPQDDARFDAIIRTIRFAK